MLTAHQFHLDVQEDQLKAGKRPGDDAFGVEPESHHGTLTTIESGVPKRNSFPTVDPTTYVEFYWLFAQALQGDGGVPVKPEDARDVLRIIEAALQSSREGRTVTV